MNILDLIKGKGDLFSLKQKQLANYILNHYKEVAFMSSTALARFSGVSNPSIIRFATTLGFSGFPEMQASLQELIQNELTALERVSLDEVNDDPVLSMVYETEVDNINRCLKVLNSGIYETIVNSVYSAEKLLIIGFQGSKYIVEKASYNLDKIRPMVFKITDLNQNYFSMIEDLGKDCTVLCFCFPRYPRNTFEMIKKCKESGMQTILVTDSTMCPLSAYSDEILALPLKYISFVDPFAAINSFINALAISITRIDLERAKRCLQRFEENAANFDLYMKDTGLKPIPLEKILKDL